MSADADGSYKMVRARSKRIVVGRKTQEPTGSSSYVWMDPKLNHLGVSLAEAIERAKGGDVIILVNAKTTPQAVTAEPLEDLSSSRQAQSD